MSALTPIRFGALLLVLQVGYVWLASHRGQTVLIGDCPYYAATAESLARDGDWDLRNQLPGELKDHEGFFALSKDERIVPKHSTLLPVLSVPFYLLFGTKGFLVFNLIQVFLLIWGIMLLAGGGCAARWLALAGYATAPFLHYTYNYSPDVLGAALVVWSFVFAQKTREPAAQAREGADSLACAAGSGGSIMSRSGPILAGLLAGLAVWAKIYLALVLLPLALLIVPLGWRKTLLCAGAAAIAVAPMLLINAHLFGAPWITGYDRDARITADGYAITEHYSRFNQPFIAGLGNLLFDERIGMLRTAPLWFLWPVGVWFALRADRARASILRTAALVLALLVNLLVFACYDEWHASAFGNRFLFPALAIGIALQGPMWERIVARGRERVAAGTKAV